MCVPAAFIQTRANGGSLFVEDALKIYAYLLTKLGDRCNLMRAGDKCHKLRGKFLMKSKNPISEAEAEVLKVLWNYKAPVTTGTIFKELSEQMGWDRSTVRTLLRRLTEKGAVEEMKLEVLAYRPVLTEEEYRHSQTKSLLERHYGGSAKRLVASLVQNKNLTSADLAELREFLQSGGDRNG